MPRRANAGRVAQRIETLDIVHICKKVPPKRTNNNEVASSDMNGSGLRKGGEVLLTTAKPYGTVACPEPRSEPVEGRVEGRHREACLRVQERFWLLYVSPLLLRRSYYDCRTLVWQKAQIPG